MSLFISEAAFSQTEIPAKFSVIGIPSFSEKEILDASTGLQSMEGIIAEGYCSELKCMVVKYDAMQIPDENEITNALKKYYRNREIYLKPETDISTIEKSYKIFWLENKAKADK